MDISTQNGGVEVFCSSFLSSRGLVHLHVGLGDQEGRRTWCGVSDEREEKERQGLSQKPKGFGEGMRGARRRTKMQIQMEVNWLRVKLKWERDREREKERKKKSVHTRMNGEEALLFFSLYLANFLMDFLFRARESESENKRPKRRRSSEGNLLKNMSPFFLSFTFPSHWVLKGVKIGILFWLLLLFTGFLL